MSDISAENINAYLKQRSDIKFIVYDTLDSTNMEAKRIAHSGVESKTVIIADFQTAGRGRLGRQFYSPKGKGLYMSFLLKNEFSDDGICLITAAASVAVCRAIEKAAGVSPSIKWVNDLYLDGKKICGILTEAVNGLQSGRIEHIIIGIGINCAEQDFPDEIKDIAGVLGNNTNRSQLAAEIICEMSQICNMVLEKSFIDEYRKRSLVVGKQITVLGNPPETAVAIDIDDFGGLVIRTDEGDIKTLSSGEISIRVCGNTTKHS